MNEVLGLFFSKSYMNHSAHPTLPIVKESSWNVVKEARRHLETMHLANIDAKACSHAWDEGLQQVCPVSHHYLVHGLCSCEHLSWVQDFGQKERESERDRERVGERECVRVCV